MESILTNSLRRADRFWLLDGAMGTQLQNKLRQQGQDPFGLQPELLNLTHPEIVTEVHREYLLAGANILYTNTFGASRKKLHEGGLPKGGETGIIVGKQIFQRRKHRGKFVTFSRGTGRPTSTWRWIFIRETPRCLTWT